ncbi:MAG: hypothetical protein OEY20_12300 [Gemmatimonadota bacterium]|nr:hypothetical protein [Gemmatimonadota bacterium]MDH4350652.1 hypothetical protein [Gemmatimonadota bacterium]MDH5198021.1 hypothetical protein [Gemmatimonadota bacterium]
MRHLTRLLVLAALLVAAAGGPSAAQVPIPRTGPPTRQDSARVADTVKVPPFRVAPPISPFGAFGRSFLIPGWGQAILGRRVTGAFFVFWEGLTLTMTLKASHQLAHIREVGTEEQIDAKKQEMQDWIVLLAFNHLLAGAEAYVSAYLWDFPIELEQRALPGNRLGFGAQLRF